VVINTGKYGGLGGVPVSQYYDPYERERQQKVYEDQYRQTIMAAFSPSQQGQQVTPIEKPEVANRDIILLLEEV
jgi:hypothetical protein